MLDEGNPIVTWRRGDWVSEHPLPFAPLSLSRGLRLTFAPPPSPFSLCKDFALAPVLVCKQPIKTVGLGDSISAAGLASAVWLRRPSA
jgi:hypothetical protein